MARSTRMLGKRRGSTQGRSGRAKVRKYTRSGNVRTGGLYRLRGMRSRRGVRNAELKYKDKYLRGTETNGNEGVADNQTTSFFRLSNGQIQSGDNDIVNVHMLTNEVYIAQSILTGLVADSGANQRIGRKVVLKSLALNMAVVGNSTGNERDECKFKLQLILDKQCNGTSASAAELYSSASGAGVATSAARELLITEQFPNVANRQRFQILKEWNWISKPAIEDDADISKTNKLITYYKRMNLPIEYGDNTGNMNTIKSNNLLLTIMCNKQSGTTSAPYFNLTGQCRVRFNDS